MVSVTLTKLLLLHPPHGDVARQQYHKLFDLMIGDTKSGYRKWEGLFLGITLVLSDITLIYWVTLQKQ